jgi:phosphoglycolate phosphatase
MIYRGVIFDLDGTLADTLADIAGSMNRILKANGFPVHLPKDYKLLVGRGLDNLVLQALPAEARTPRIASPLLDAMVEDYRMHCLDETCLYAGIRELLYQLAELDIKLAVFSNKSEPLTRKIVEHLLGDIKFVQVAGARPEFPKKPDPSGALELAHTMGLLPGEIVYVGDSDVDMITATRAGMLAVGVVWGFRSADELVNHGAKFLLKQISDLIHVFKGAHD